MSRRTVQKQNHLGARVEALAKTGPRYSHVIACVDISPTSRKVIPHALAVAKGLGGRLTLVEVIKTPASGGAPVDPVEWDIQRREAQARILALAEEYGGKGVIETRVLEGESAEQICNCALENATDLTALCTHGHGDAAEWDLGNTAHRVIDTAPGAILLVPASVPEDRDVKYTRLLVPLDGSLHAESALPVAIRIAKTYGAKLLLVHVIPNPEITEIGPLESEDIKLRERLVRRNERVARDYLDRIRTRVVDDDLSARTLILRDGEARRLLAHTIADEAIDLVVLASHGHSGHTDVPFGSVAAYLIARTVAPLLMVRNHISQRADLVYGEVGSVGIRLPHQSE